MYEELIAALRYCDGGECDGCCRYTKEEGHSCYTLLRDAADAIEELSKRVPPVPHGRLIDADAFFDDLLFPSKQFEQGMRELIGDAPTVIEAEETLKEAADDQNNS